MPDKQERVSSFRGLGARGELEPPRPLPGSVHPPWRTRGLRVSDRAVGAMVLACALSTCSYSDDRLSLFPDQDGAAGAAGSLLPVAGGAGVAGAAGAAGAAASPQVNLDPPLTVGCDDLLRAAGTGEWTSAHVGFEAGRLTYPEDAAGNHIVDFSYAGYHHGEVALPDVAEVVRLSPVAGDNSTQLQQAIDDLAARAPDASGFRGAIVLEPGRYELAQTVYLRESGVVLRGSGQDDDPATSTILYAPESDEPSLVALVVGSGADGDWRDEEADTRRNVVDALVPLGARSFEVDDASPYAVGDNVVLVHPSTQAFIDQVELGGVLDPAEQWTAGNFDIVFNRRITDLDGNTVSVDVPLYYALDSAIADAYLYRTTRAGIVDHVGVENLRVELFNHGPDDADHEWIAIRVSTAEDAWLRDVTTTGFGAAGVRTNTANRLTLVRVSAIQPDGVTDAPRHYNFDLNHSTQQVLAVGCRAEDGRMHFNVTGNSSSSGIVFVDCESVRAHGSSGAMRYFSQAILLDGVRELESIATTQVFGLHNRGDMGTGHGWAATHSVLWGCSTGDGHAVVQSPPVGANYAIGGEGDFVGTPPYPGDPGVIEQPTGELVPASLYRAQICERLGR